MKDWPPLARQLTITVFAVALTTMSMTCAGFGVVYWCIHHYAPSLMPSADEIWPNRMDFLIFACVALIGLVITTWVATRTARRIVRPMISVADAARLVASGDLTARAKITMPLPSETAILVQDFNTMAEKLEVAASATRVWNAQIAHELRTPLAILSGRLQGISEGIFTADHATIDNLRKHVAGLVRLVEDLRIVSLVESGYFRLEISDVNVAEEIRDVVTLMRQELEALGLVVELDMMPGTARLDPARLRQTMIALLDNASKYAAPGTVVLKVKIEKERLEISMRDSGTGIQFENESEIFEPFRRFVANSKIKTGSGLGLAIVKNIVQAHGGTASYKARENTFLLSFPFTSTQ